MKKKIAIFGVSGFGREIMPLARQQLDASNESYDLVFVDDKPPSNECNGHRVINYDEWLKEPGEERLITFAIADGYLRKNLVKRVLGDGVRFFQIRAKNVIQFDNVTLGEGYILCSFVHLTSNLKIGKHFQANIYSYVAHDCLIGDYVTFAPRVMCNGNVVIKDHAYIGTGAIIKQGKPGKPLVIGEGAVVGMGAVVTKNVPEGVTVVGNPARQIHKI